MADTTSDPLPRQRLAQWLKARGMSQNALAEAIGREPSWVSRVIRGKEKSGPVWREIRAYMRSPKRYRPKSIRSVRQRAALARAREILRRGGVLS